MPRISEQFGKNLWLIPQEHIHQPGGTHMNDTARHCLPPRDTSATSVGLCAKRWLPNSAPLLTEYTVILQLPLRCSPHTATRSGSTAVIITLLENEVSSKKATVKNKGAYHHRSRAHEHGSAHSKVNCSLVSQKCNHQNALVQVAIIYRFVMVFELHWKR